MSNLAGLLFVCRKYESLGSAVQAQLADLNETGSAKGVNPNALKSIQQFLRVADRFARTSGEGLEGVVEEISDLQQIITPALANEG